MVWLIRHGESESNAGGITSDPATIALTARGQQQAAAVAEAFPSAPDLIVASPFLRTGQTAAPTRSRFPHAGVAEWPIQEFTFLAPERCRSMSADDRRRLVDEYWDRADPFYVDGPGAESFEAFAGRVKEFRHRLASVPGFVAIFSHGAFIRAAVSDVSRDYTTLEAKAMRQFRRFLLEFPIPNGAVMESYSDSNSLSIRRLIIDHLVDGCPARSRDRDI